MKTIENLIEENMITFPCNGKIPKIKNWNLLTEKVNHNIYENYGILCGYINDLIVIDCDIIKNDDPEKYICEGDCPKFDCTDNAFMERLVVVPMRSKFVNGDEDLKTFTFKCNPNLVSEFDKWKSSLLKFFLKYVNKKGLNGMKLPDSMTSWKTEIMNENNDLKDWLFSIVVEDKDGFVSLNDLKEKYRIAFPHERNLKNKDIERMINALFINKGVYLKEQHNFYDQNKERCQKRNIYLGYKPL